MPDFPTWERVLLLIPALLVAFTVHEYMHARVALALGDTTARDSGRITLNPIPHLDPIGTLVLIIAGFGWAKPVPINVHRFKNPRVDTVWVSLAGPGANLAAAFVFAMILLVSSPIIGNVGIGPLTVTNVLFEIVRINLVLMIFNLFPIPPLDGSKVVPLFLNTKQLHTWTRFEPYGMFVLLGIVLLLPGLFGELIQPVVVFFMSLFGLITF